MTPIRFIIPQRPVSQQATKNGLRRWKNVVCKHGRQAVGENFKILSQPLAVRIYYFYTEVALDVDNILKPVLDALKGVVYDDDSIISDIEVRRRNVQSSVELASPPATLLEGLELKNDFVYVEISDPPPQDALP